MKCGLSKALPKFYISIDSLPNTNDFMEEFIKKRVCEEQWLRSPECMIEILLQYNTGYIKKKKSGRGYRVFYINEEGHEVNEIESKFKSTIYGGILQGLW